MSAAPGFGHCDCCRRKRALWRVAGRWLCKVCKAGECSHPERPAVVVPGAVSATEDAL